MTKEQIRERVDNMLVKFEKESFVSRFIVEDLAMRLVELGREIERGEKKGGKK